MKKRLISSISLIACLCFVFIFSVSHVNAAGSGSQYTADTFSSYMQEWMNTWFAGDLDAMKSYNDQYAQSGLAVKYDVDKDKYTEAVKKAGTFKKFEKPELTEDGDVITVKQTAVCEKKNVVFVFVYNVTESSVTWTADVEASLGDLIVRALLNTLMGMGTVFLVLIFISFVIAMFTLPSYFRKRKESKEGVLPETPAEVESVEVISEVTAEDDDELVAVISAAVAAYEAEAGDDYEVPEDGLYVRSIKKRGFAN